MELRKGQKIPLNENLLNVKFVRNASNIEIDTAAFLQGDSVKVADEDFIFYGNPKHNSGGIIHREDDSLSLNLQKIPARIQKISFTATIYDAEKRRQNFSKLSGANLKIFSAETGAELANFPITGTKATGNLMQSAQVLTEDLPRFVKILELKSLRKKIRRKKIFRRRYLHKLLLKQRRKLKL